jgi:hypothetical protein
MCNTHRITAASPSRGASHRNSAPGFTRQDADTPAPGRNALLRGAGRLALACAMPLSLSLSLCLGAALPAEVRAQLPGDDNVDFLVTHPDISFRDPEWAIKTPEIAYCGENSLVHIAQLDPDTGRILDPTGADSKLLGPCKNTGNGPEWGYMRNTDLLSWTVQYGSAEYMALAMRERGQEEWREENPLPESRRLHWPFPIKMEDTDRPLVLFYEQGPEVNIWARAAMRPAEFSYIASNTKFPKWVRGTYEVVYTTPAGAVETKHVLTGERRTWIEPGGAALQNPIIWRAPETGRLALLAINELTNVQTCIQIYFLVPEVEFHKRICGEAETRLSSAEIFVLNNRSYVSFQFNREISWNKDIFAASAIDLEGEEPFYRRLSNNVKRARKDPEPYVGSDRAYIYYTASTDPDSVTGPRGIWVTEFLGRDGYGASPSTATLEVLE